MPLICVVTSFMHIRLAPNQSFESYMLYGIEHVITQEVTW